ncbi:MAG: hypothetical protein HYZ42_14665 [Bacteroidetes bacterium]|nr:hypothetical protein [Bacteroidota bacterium]
MTTLIAKGQTFEKSFQGRWADTRWVFEFHKDGTYQRKSFGHFGNTTIKGKYIIKGDSIYLLKRFHIISGIVNEIYLLDKDSMLIELDLRYDYAPVSKSGDNSHYSQIRFIKYPQIATDNQYVKSELEKVMNLAFNSTFAKQYYHFDSLPQRRLLFADYLNLKANIHVDSIAGIFIPAENISDSFYIEFEDINQSANQIIINIKIHGEGLRIWFNYIKKKGQWIAQKPLVTES